MIYQELWNFVVIKPTVSSTEERTLGTVDIPKVVMCLDPGFDNRVLEKYGYVASEYYRGFIGNKGSLREKKQGYI